MVALGHHHLHDGGLVLVRLARTASVRHRLAEHTCSILDLLGDHTDKLLLICTVVHTLQDLVPEPRLDGALLNRLNGSVELRFGHVWVLLLDDLLHQQRQRVLDMQLDEAELLIAFVLEDLAEQTRLVVLLFESVDRVQDRLQVLDDELSQAVLLVEVSVQILLHRLARLAALLTCSVELYLLCVDISKDLPQLLQGQVTFSDLPERSICHLLADLLLFLRRVRILRISGCPGYCQLL